MSTDALKVLAWNILHGGGPKRVPEIALALLEHAPDVIVLSEFRAGRGGQIRAVLADHGWAHQAAAPGREGRNGILIASRLALRRREDRFDRACADGRWLDVLLPEIGLDLSGCHVPDDSLPRDKAAYWRFLIRLAKERAPGCWLALGDFNSGRRRIDEEGATFGCPQLLGAFVSHGMTDAWRHLHPKGREYSWFSHAGSGFRIDTAYVSGPLRERLRGASLSHGERERGLSDHSALVVEFAGLGRCAGGAGAAPAGLFGAGEGQIRPKNAPPAGV